MLNKYIQLYIQNTFFVEERLLNKICLLHLNKKASKGVINRLLINSKINWARFFNLLEKNRLQVVAYKTIKDCKLEAEFPKELIEKLLKSYLEIQMLSIKHQLQSKRVLIALNRGKLNYLVMKPYFLYERLYKNEFYKIPADLDLLLPVAQFQPAFSILKDLNYNYYAEINDKKPSSNIPGDLFYNPKSQEIFKKKAHMVELHTKIVDTFHFLPEPLISADKNATITHELFSRGKRTNFKGVTIKAFSLNDLLISMFLHSLIQHNAQISLSLHEWLKILLEFEHKIDWNYILTFIKKYKLEKHFLYYLSLTDTLYPKTLPQKIGKKVQIYNKQLNMFQKILLKFMCYKVFNPTYFAQDIRKEKEKEWFWAIIANNFGGLLFNKVKYRFFK
jgi:hypothetical protein